jgi:hypothetical protein
VTLLAFNSRFVCSVYDRKHSNERRRRRATVPNAIVPPTTKHPSERERERERELVVVLATGSLSRTKRHQGTFRCLLCLDTRTSTLSFAVFASSVATAVLQKMAVSNSRMTSQTGQDNCSASSIRQASVRVASTHDELGSQSQERLGMCATSQGHQTNTD